MEIYVLVVKLIIRKLLFILVLQDRWLIDKTNIISAFTQGKIDISILLNSPEGFNSLNDKALKLHKVLYGLKRLVWIWYYIFKNVLDELDIYNLISEK